MAVARLMGRSQRLVLCDVDEARLQQARRQLDDEGFASVGVPGDLSDPTTIDQVAATCRRGGSLRTVVNAAGLSPTMANWRAIVSANVLAPMRLLDALEPMLVPGTVAVMLASVAGYLGPADDACDALLVEGGDTMLDQLAPHIEALHARIGGTLEGHAYSLSKRAVMLLCERRAMAWGRRGARIVSISPGGIWTAMGRREAEIGRRVTTMIENTPIQRWGTAMDMATAIEFLASDAASYITGCDLRIDGGAVANLGGKAF